LGISRAFPRHRRACGARQRIGPSSASLVLLAGWGQGWFSQSLSHCWLLYLQQTRRTYTAVGYIVTPLVRTINSSTSNEGRQRRERKQTTTIIIQGGALCTQTKRAYQ
ncbi:unnamed protein product, partial [Ectocarpus fasciculatus]